MAFNDVPTATAAIQAHPLCAEFVSMTGRYLVYYPPQYRIPGGVMVIRSGNDVAALNTLYNQMVSFAATVAITA